MSEMPILSGFQWWTYPRGWRDVARCIVGRHRKVMTGVFPGDDASPVFRCSCGALWQTMPDGGCWLPDRRPARGRRKGVAVPADQYLAEMRATLETIQEQQSRPPPSEAEAAYLAACQESARSGEPPPDAPEFTEAWKAEHA